MTLLIQKILILAIGSVFFWPSVNLLAQQNAQQLAKINAEIINLSGELQLDSTPSKANLDRMASRISQAEKVLTASNQAPIEKINELKNLIESVKSRRQILNDFQNPEKTKRTPVWQELQACLSSPRLPSKKLTLPNGESAYLLPLSNKGQDKNSQLLILITEEQILTLPAPKSSTPRAELVYLNLPKQGLVEFIQWNSSLYSREIWDAVPRRPLTIFVPPKKNILTAKVQNFESSYAEITRALKTGTEDLDAEAGQGSSWLEIWVDHLEKNCSGQMASIKAQFHNCNRYQTGSQDFRLCIARDSTRCLLSLASSQAWMQQSLFSDSPHHSFGFILNTCRNFLTSSARGHLQSGFDKIETSAANAKSILDKLMSAESTKNSGNNSSQDSGAK